MNEFTFYKKGNIRFIRRESFFLGTRTPKAYDFQQNISWTVDTKKLSKFEGILQYVV